jgi:transposase-like protein
MTNDPLSRPIVPPAREGHRRAFSDEDKRRIVEEASQPGASLSAVAGRYGMAARVVFRWKQELASSAAVPVFVAVQSLSTGIRRASALTTGTTDCAATAFALK